MECRAPFGKSHLFGQGLDFFCVGWNFFGFAFRETGPYTCHQKGVGQGKRMLRQTSLAQCLVRRFGGLVDSPEQLQVVQDWVAITMVCSNPQIGENGLFMRAASRAACAEDS